MANNEIVRYVSKLYAGSSSEVTHTLKEIGNGDMRGGIQVLQEIAYKSGAKGKNEAIAIAAASLIVLAADTGYKCVQYYKNTHRKKSKRVY